MMNDRGEHRPSFITVGLAVRKGVRREGRGRAHIIRLERAHRAPSSFSAVILDRASEIGVRCAAVGRSVAVLAAAGYDL